MEAQFTRLQHFPISFFSVILGLSGLTIVAQRAETILHLSWAPGSLYLGFTLVLYFGILFTVLLKSIRHWPVVRKEYFHPIKINFYPASTISLMLLSIALLSVNKDAARVFWVVGAAGHLLFTLSILSIWLRHTRFEVQHKNPAWFIPVVGNIIAPVAGVELFPAALSWFFFSVGFILWLVLFTIFLYRAFFHQPIQEKLLPTFFILIAPPAVAFIAYTKLTGQIDAFGSVLYYFGLFLTLLLFFNLDMFVRIKFYLSWWAYSFPLSAITLASLLMYHQGQLVLLKYLAIGLLVLLHALVLFLLVRTVQAMVQKKICVED